MKDIVRDELGAPKIVDRSTFQAELDALRVREKAHTREGDAIAAPRNDAFRKAQRKEGTTRNRAWVNAGWVLAVWRIWLSRLSAFARCAGAPSASPPQSAFSSARAPSGGSASGWNPS